MDSNRVALTAATEKNWRNVLEGMVDFAARQAYAGCMVDGLRRYLYFAESTRTHFGHLVTLRDCDPEPEGYELAQAEPIMTAADTFPICRAKVSKAVGRLPLIATGYATGEPLRGAGQYTPADGITHD
jgi:hypothetical protein